MLLLDFAIITFTVEFAALLPRVGHNTPAMSLDNRLQKKFRSIGHHLNPVVIVSNGLSDNINAEIDRALSDHELIKVRVNAADREDKKSLIEEICQLQKAELVQTIGNIALIYRAAAELKPHLSNICRHPEIAG